jgi:hypothetical protein
MGDKHNSPKVMTNQPNVKIPKEVFPDKSTIPIRGEISTSIALVCYNLGRLLFVYKVYKIHPFTKGQFVIIALGLLTFFLCHYLQNIFQDLWIQMLFISSFVALLFFGSIYFFKLEKETVNYVNNSMDFLIKKIRGKN